jgi:hypothetical protein
LARRLFGDADPTGQTIHLAETTGELGVVFGSDSDADGIFVPPPADPAAYEISGRTARRVIGVSEDFRMTRDVGRNRAGAALFLDYRSAFGPEATMTRSATLMRANKFLVRSVLESAALGDAVRTRLGEADPYFEIESTDRLDALVARAIGGTGGNRLMLSVALTFGTLSLLLAAVGVYGVASHAVSRRTPEFGIRMALGARPRDVASIVLVQALRLAIAGLALGLAAAWATTRVLESVLFRTSPSDPATFAAVTLCLLVVALAASLGPALRAAAADPLAATRME